MRIEVEHVFNNRNNDKSLEDLRNESNLLINKMISKLVVDPGIIIDRIKFHELFWNIDDYEKGAFSKSFDDIRTSFVVTKNGRSLYSKRDIYKIVNSIKVGYFSN